MIKEPKKDKYVRFKNFKRKINSSLLIYAHFKIILAPEDNGKQNPEEPYTNKYQKHVASTYGYKLIRVDDRLSIPFKSYLGEDAVYNVVNSMIEESKFCTHVMKKKNNKELVMPKEDDTDFENSNEYLLFTNSYVDGDLYVRDHWSVLCRWKI